MSDALAGPVLAGRHVRLVPLCLDHAPALVAAATEPGGAFEWTHVERELDAMRTFIDRQLGLVASGTWISFATVRLADDRVVGSTSYLDIQRWGTSWLEPGDSVSSVEIGATWLAASARRTAVNTEAKLLMLTHAFETWGVQRVQLKTDARNEVSRNAIARLGAQFEGVLRNFQPGLGTRGAGAPRDTAMFSILPAEWPAARERLVARLASG